MSNSNISPNGIPLDVAYQFHSFSEYIRNNGLQTRFSPKCIFCPSMESTPLQDDGSFRQCCKCKKQFKASFLRN
jgi:hypothetical protein